LGIDQNFEDLVFEYQDKVYNTCLGFLKNEDDAKDVSQEVFIHIYTNLAGFREDSSIGTWIYRIAVNACLGEIRKSKRKALWVTVLRMGENSESNIGFTDFHHPGIELENKERAQVLFNAIEQLPEQQKIAFTMNKLEGLPYSEIGQVMEKSLSSIESLMHRAKKNLQNHLKKYYDGE